MATTAASLLSNEATGQQKSPPKYTNRLAREESPYLLQHAHNPVSTSGLDYLRSDAAMYLVLLKNI